MSELMSVMKNAIVEVPSDTPPPFSLSHEIANVSRVWFRGESCNKITNVFFLWKSCFSGVGPLSGPMVFETSHMAQRPLFPSLPPSPSPALVGVWFCCESCYGARRLIFLETSMLPFPELFFTKRFLVFLPGSAMPPAWPVGRSLGRSAGLPVSVGWSVA